MSELMAGFFSASICMMFTAFLRGSGIQHPTCFVLSVFRFQQFCLFYVPGFILDRSCSSSWKVLFFCSTVLIYFRYSYMHISEDNVSIDCQITTNFIILKVVQCSLILYIRQSHFPSVDMNVLNFCKQIDFRFKIQINSHFIKRMFGDLRKMTHFPECCRFQGAFLSLLVTVSFPSSNKIVIKQINQLPQNQRSRKQCD